MDHNVSRAIANGLRARGVDVITAFEDGKSELEDPALLDRASELERVLFTHDNDLLVEAARRQRNGESFHGVVFARQLRVSVGEYVADLELLVKAADAEDVIGQTIYLPL